MWNFGLPGSTRSGENARKKSSSALQPLRLEHRLHHFVGRPRIRRRLEDDQLAALERGRNRFHRLDDVGQIGILGLPQRRRDADVDDVHVRRARPSSVVARRRAGVDDLGADSALGTSGM